MHADIRRHILNSLSTDTWQTGPEVTHAVARALIKQHGRGFIGSLLAFFSDYHAEQWLIKRQALGTLYRPLLELREQGQVERRWQTEAETRPDYNREHVYRLTPAGLEQRERTTIRAPRRTFLPEQEPESVI